MKKFLLVVFIAMVSNTYAQTFDEWFRQKETQIKYLIEQIGALRAYGEVINKGYDITHNGLATIFKSKDSDCIQHSSYFLSLWKVKLGIKSYSRVLSIYQMKAAIEKQYQAIHYPAEFLSTKDEAYINDVFSNLLNECSALTGDLQMVISDNQLELKDDERIARIDKIFFQMQDRYQFSQSFSSQVNVLVISRLGEKHELDKLSSLYGIQ